MTAPSNWIPQKTDDGSFTFFSDEFGEAFHSTKGAQEEALEKFVKATLIPEKAHRPVLRLLDVCYGLGYNTAAALETIWSINPHCQVALYGLELDSTVPIAATTPDFLGLWSPRVQEVLKAIALQQQHQSTAIDANLLLGDARQQIQSLIQSNFLADAVFFDPFSPRRCPQLWTVEFFSCTVRCMAQDGRLATYSRSASVRSAMRLAGLTIGTIPMEAGDRPSHEWSQGTIGAFSADLLHPLSQMEQEHLHTRAAIPYRDPSLNDSAAAIHDRHKQEQQSSQAESTTSWRRRWGIY